MRQSVGESEQTFVSDHLVVRDGLNGLDIKDSTAGIPKSCAKLNIATSIKPEVG